MEADPELGLRVPADRISRARNLLRASVEDLDCGGWDVPGAQSTHSQFGFLVLRGLMARDVILAGSVSTELVGEGDLVEPPEPVRDDRLVRYHVSWHVLSPLTVAVLDDRFSKLVVEWPQVTAALLERTLRRTRRMSIHQALLALSPVETRLLVLFWHLAERWGRVTGAGVVLPLHLTHEVLGQLVGCQRASVTTALKEVAESGLATRRDDGTWLLSGHPPDELSQLHWHQRRGEPGTRSHGAARRREPVDH